MINLGPVRRLGRKPAAVAQAPAHAVAASAAERASDNLIECSHHAFEPWTLPPPSGAGPRSLPLRGRARGRLMVRTGYKVLGLAA
jgi:hypothetical protein